MRTRRNVIDYALKRRARLAQVRSGMVTTAEACDAHPHLLLAARHYGSAAGTACPICGGKDVQVVRFVYGDELGVSAGQAKSVGELERMEASANAVAVYVVEVCPACRWNHLLESFVMGRGDVAPVEKSRAR